MFPHVTYLQPKKESAETIVQVNFPGKPYTLISYKLKVPVLKVTPGKDVESSATLNALTFVIESALPKP